MVYFSVFTYSSNIISDYSSLGQVDKKPCNYDNQLQKKCQSATVSMLFFLVPFLLSLFTRLLLLLGVRGFRYGWAWRNYRSHTFQ